MRAYLNHAAYTESENEILRQFVFSADLHFANETVSVRNMQRVWRQLLSVMATRIRRSGEVWAQVEQGRFPGISICTRADAPGVGGLFIRLQEEQDGQQELGCWFALEEDVCAIRAQVAEWLRAFGFGGHMVYLKNDYPEFSHEQNELGCLDREVHRRVAQGQSALQIALSDDLVDRLGDGWYGRCLEILKDRLDNRRTYESIEAILAQTPYASKILWFRAAFETYDGGRSHARGFRDSLGGGDNYYIPMQEFGKAPPFPFDESQSPNRPRESNRFREYVWFMAGPGREDGVGRTSELTYGLKELCRDGETDYSVDSDLYEKEDAVWHLGKDLRQFVDFVRNRVRQDDEVVAAQWIRKLYDIFNKAFPAFNDVDVSAAQFLDYDPDGDHAPNVILGLWGARFNNGYNRISCELPNDAESQDVSREWLTCGCYKIPLRDQAFGRVQIRGSIDGLDERELGSVELSSVCGLYVRATESRYGRVGLRRNWWRKIEKGGGVRFGRALLLCLPGHVLEPQLPQTLLNHYRVARSVETQICQDGQLQDYTLIVLTPYTLGDALARVDLNGVLNCDFSFEIKPKPMAIAVRDCSEELVSESGEIICGDDDALVLSRVCEVDWFVDGRKISSGTTLAMNAADMDYGLAVEVECQSDEKRVCRPIKVVRLPISVVDALKSGRAGACSQEWRIDIEESLEYAVEGCEICSISHVNAFGAGDSSEIRVRRPVSRASWWIEEQTDAFGRHAAHDLRNGVGENHLRGDLARYRLAVPVAFVDTPVRCDEVISRLVEDDWRDPEERRWRGRYKVVSLETVVRRTEGLSSVYPFGETLSQRTIYFGDSPIVRFEDSPVAVSWAKTRDGELGVYFPNGANENAIRISVFTDNVQARGFDLDRPLSEVVVSCDDAMQHDDAGRFFPITDLLQRCCELDARGELWGVLTYRSETVTRRTLLSADKVLKLCVARSDQFLPPQADGMCSYYFIRLVDVVKDCQPNTPYAGSRLVQYVRAHSDALQSDSWWFENGTAERISLNECRDLSDEEVGTMKLCLTARAMADAIGRSLSALPNGVIEVDGQQLISRVSVSRIAQYQRQRGTHYHFGTERPERAVFAVQDNDQTRRIFSYNPAFAGPVLCKRGNEWGCYLPVELEIPPVVWIYTDNPRSDYFKEGCPIREALTVGFNSLQGCVNQIWRGDQQGELYLAMFKDTSVDPRFVAGNFLNADGCQVVCVVTHCFELYDRLSPDITVLRDVAMRVGSAFSDNCTEEAHMWSRSRLLRFYRAEHDEAMNEWIANDFNTCLPSGIELSYNAAKETLARLMEHGINFLAEPHFMCGAFDRFREALGYERAMTLFRDQPRDWEADAAGNGLCAAVVVCRDLQQRNVGSCKEMDERYRFELLNNVVQDLQIFQLNRVDFTWPQCLEGGWRALANSMNDLRAWIRLRDRICYATSNAYKTLTLTGILLGINLEVALRQNRTLLERGTPIYDLCLRVAYTAFMYRHDCDIESRWGAWRCLMRSMCATMRMIEGM